MISYTAIKTWYFSWKIYRIKRKKVSLKRSGNLLNFLFIFILLCFIIFFFNIFVLFTYFFMFYIVWRMIVLCCVSSIFYFYLCWWKYMFIIAVGEMFSKLVIKRYKQNIVWHFKPQSLHYLQWTIYLIQESSLSMYGNKEHIWASTGRSRECWQ